MTPAEQMASELGEGWFVVNETTVRNYDKVANVSRYETVSGFHYLCEGAHGANDFIMRGYGNTPKEALGEWEGNVNKEIERARNQSEWAKKHVDDWLEKMEKIASWVNNVSTASPTN